MINWRPAKGGALKLPGAVSTCSAPAPAASLTLPCLALTSFLPSMPTAAVVAASSCPAARWRLLQAISDGAAGWSCATALSFSSDSKQLVSARPAPLASVVPWLSLHPGHQSLRCCTLRRCETGACAGAGQGPPPQSPQPGQPQHQPPPSPTTPRAACCGRPRWCPCPVRQKTQ